MLSLKPFSSPLVTLMKNCLSSATELLVCSLNTKTYKELMTAIHELIDEYGEYDACEIIRAEDGWSAKVYYEVEAETLDATEIIH